MLASTVQVIIVTRTHLPTVQSDLRHVERTPLGLTNGQLATGFGS